MSGKLGLAAGRPSENRKAQAMAALAEQSARPVRVNFDLNESDHLRLKIHAAQTRQTVTDILRDLVTKYVP